MNNDIKCCEYEGCNKRLKISDFPCKCEKIFCKMHRLPEQHLCQYDYKENDTKNKKIENMKCVSNKIQKIN